MAHGEQPAHLTCRLEVRSEESTVAAINLHDCNVYSYKGDGGHGPAL